MNLTAVTEFESVAKKHFADSVSILSHFEVPEGAGIIDVGSGAGFPGLPIKIMRPDVRLTLLDSLAKRVDFLEGTAEMLGLSGVECIHARAEDAARDDKLREGFDIALSRGVAALKILAEYCLPFVKVGGAFVAYKAETAREEALDAKNAVAILGGKLESIESFSLCGMNRSLVVIRKVKETPGRYPRKAGTPTKKPL